MGRKRPPIEQTYSPEEAADYCRVTRRTVYRWLSDGSLSANKAGPRTWVITQTQLNAFLQKPEKKPTGAKPLEKLAAKPIQPELPSELLPQGTGELMPIEKPQHSGKIDTEQEPHREAVSVTPHAPQAQRLLPGVINLYGPKPEAGKKRPEGAKK